MRIANMATAAPRYGDRNTTGTRLGPFQRIEPGSVLLNGDRFVVAWIAVQTGWLALPIVMQTAPLHRSDVIVGADAMLPSRSGVGRMLVKTAEPVLLQGRT